MTRATRLMGATTFVLGMSAAWHVLMAQNFPETPRFEVASLRRVDRSAPFPGSSVLRVTESGQLVGRLPLRNFIVRAYGVKGGERLVAAEPAVSRALEEHFEVWAIPPSTAAPPTREAVLAMTRQLLAERLAVRVRIDTEMADAYVLEVARPGVLGRGLRPAPEGCTELPAGANPGDPKLAEAFQRSCVLTHWGERLRGIVTLNQFARVLSDYSNYPIVNRTGLEGFFAIDVNMSTGSLWNMARTPRTVLPQSNAPAFLDALRDQMGLVARRERQPVRLLVVEHVGPLVEN